MAKLFVNQAMQYAEARPNYPPLLFHFTASKTSYHSFAWDVATGRGQAAKSLAALYKNVIATDVSEKQLESATKLPNVECQHTPSTMSLTNLEQKVELQGTVNLVTIAQALHWFNLPTFYEQVKWILKKPQEVIVGWCYNLPRVSDEVDTILDQLYSFDASSYWNPSIRLIDGVDHTGPFEFMKENLLDFNDFFKLI